MPVQVQNSVLCYMTDSEGNFLLDANGVPVSDSGSDDGVFNVVVNKKGTEVATNPGQFYFNLLWWNQGSVDRTVVVDMQVPTPLNVVAHGTNAVHSALFQGNTPFTQDNFNCANDGSTCYSTPHGASGVTGSITIPTSATLLVTYHLEWKWLNKLWSAGCSTAGCPISVTGVVYEGPTEAGRCTAGATGFRKN